MKAALYCRLSEEDRDKATPEEDSRSIQNQKNMLIRHALDEGWEIFDIYNDEDYKGADRSRPQFNRLLADAEARKFDIILCKTQSRFTRELELVEKYIHGCFPQWGIRFVGLVDNADTHVRGNKKSRQINGLVNEWYIEDLSESVSAALDTMRGRGQYIGAFPLYGYRKSLADKGRLEVDEVAALTVRRIFRLYCEGSGLTAIAKRLNDEGVPNPTAYKAALGMKCAAKRRASLASTWSVNTVRGILRNAMYTGDMVQGRYEKASYKSRALRSVPRERWMVVPGTHEAIIDRDTWEKTQALLTQHTRMGRGGAVHLFAGMAYCARCGSALHSNYAGGIRYLRCPMGEVAKARCPGASVSLEELERLVLEGINDLVQRCFDEVRLCGMVILPGGHETERKALAAEAERQRKTVVELRRAALSLYRDKAAGTLTEGSYRALAQELAAEQAEAQRYLDTLEARVAALLQTTVCQTKQEVVAPYRHFDTLDRELVHAFVERVEVGGRDAATRTIPVKVVWKV